jgi:hypothetical protein
LSIFALFWKRSESATRCLSSLVIIFLKSLGNMRSNLTTLIYVHVAHNETWEEVGPIEGAQKSIKSLHFFACVERPIIRATMITHVILIPSPNLHHTHRNAFYVPRKFSIQWRIQTLNNSNALNATQSSMQKYAFPSPLMPNMKLIF